MNLSQDQQHEHNWHWFGLQEPLKEGYMTATAITNTQ
jgi:hypothetical protein